MSAAEAENNVGPSDGSARRETFLARYPRKLKLGALGLIIAALLLPWLLFGGSQSHELRTTKAAISGSDSRAALVNQAPLSPLQSDRASPKEGAGASTPEEVSNDTSSVFLRPAPDLGVSEETPQGSLPRIGEDGRQPWQVYARPFNTNDKRPRIAIVITDLGMSRVSSDAAITRLPSNVDLAFNVQSPVVGAWLARARQAGHETILMLPMEPFDYPRSDPGPNSLLSNLPNSDNLQRLQWALMQASGYVGVTTLSGSRLTTDPSKITPILDVIHKRGLMVLDARVAPHSAITDLARTAHIPVAVNTERLDRNLSPEAIDEALNHLEQTARLNGQAVGIAPALPILLERLAEWTRQLPRDGIALAPLTAVAQ